MFKSELIQHIKLDYKELNNLSIRIDEENLDDTLYNLLTPYLAHKNTIDKQNRIICFYTRGGVNNRNFCHFTLDYPTTIRPLMKSNLNSLKMY